MKWPYLEHVSIDPISGEPQIALRPEVFITLRGPAGSRRYQALVDTGADYTIFPSAAATSIGVRTQPTLGTEAQTFGGHRLKTRFGEVQLELDAGNTTYAWAAHVLFHESDEDAVVLGHVAFLHYFVAVFDGLALELSLMPVDDFPGIIREQSAA